jgi:hypothetical protein
MKTLSIRALDDRRPCLPYIQPQICTKQDSSRYGNNTVIGTITGNRRPSRT